MVQKKFTIQVLHIEGFAIVMYNAVSLVNQVVNLFDEIRRVFVTKVYFILAQPFSRPTQHSAGFYYHCGRDKSLS